jgi:hypothetical protein
MTSSRPIFGTGLARSGGGLYSSLLTAHPQMMVAICPYLELFRSFRNAVFAKLGPAAQSVVPPKAPLQDYYFSDERIRLLDAMLAADLDLPFDQGQWELFHQTSVARADLEAADLTPHFARLRGATYKEMFANALRIIGDTRDANRRKWVGFHEAWVIEFYPALARAFPDARFLVMLRDPRATVNSMLGVRRIDPSQLVQVISYARHWRKYVALAHHSRDDPLVAGRIHVTSHDRILTKSEEAVRDICTFFEVPYDPRMLDSGNFVDFTTKATWKGNSSFEEKTEGISAHRASRWRTTLPAIVLDTVEWLCGPEMRLVGYETLTAHATAPEPSEDIIDYLIRESAAPTNWRSDFGDPMRDVGYELFRKRLLGPAGDAAPADVLRRCFLEPEMRARLATRRAGAQALRVS